MNELTGRKLAADVISDRLILRPMTADFLTASLAGDGKKAGVLLGGMVHVEWLAERALMEIRQGQLERNPALLPWLLRAVLLGESGEMIGHFNFHGPPGAAFLRPIAANGLELGYTIYTPFRRQGYAAEAILAMMAWAAQHAPVDRFILSIHPDNASSISLARKLNFQHLGPATDLLEDVDEGEVEELYIFDRLDGMSEA